MLKNLKTFSLPEVELKVLDFWKKNKVFEKSLARRRQPASAKASAFGKPSADKSAGKGKRFIFYEGPPTANAPPAIHHVIARAFKDIIPRYKTMRGYYVPRQAGWDTHGLPVELQVEKQLGFKSKKDIEKFGIAEFNRKCKESVWRFKEEWERFTERVGFWVDMKNPYITYEPKYIESLWWIIAQFFKKGFMYKGYKVAPWCPRCGTTLSSHELAQGYKEVSDDSVYLKFKLKKGQKIANVAVNDKTYILSWTTTPWTLPGNVALAVRGDIKYVLVEVSGETWILAEEIYKKKPSIVYGASKLERTVKGKDLVGLRYEPLFDIQQLQNLKSHTVYDADFVTTADGTGVVHTAVMYGEDDYTLGTKVGLPQHHTVSEDGRFTKEVGGFANLYVKDKETDKKIFDYLKRNNNLIKTESYLHEYPHCWRCDTPLLYYARTSWFVSMSKLRKELLKENGKINWVPAHFKNGRFGEWLEEVKDWNFSRERYWGTPIPIWQCDKCSNVVALGSIDEIESVGDKSTNRYILVRHGEAENNIRNVLNSDPANGNFHLTLKGRTEVETTAKKLKKEKVDFIFSSDITRAKETAELLAGGLKIKNVFFDKRLEEIGMGEFEGRSDEEYGRFFPSHEDKFTKRPDGGENLTDVRARMFSFASDIERKYDGKTILVVSHEDSLLMLASTLAGFSERETIAAKWARLAEAPARRGDGEFLEKGNFREFKFRGVPRNETGEIDLHRPYVDQVHFPCKKCGGRMARTPEVADVWFDSGSMPFASIHYPFENKNLIDKNINYPADYIAEAVDQTRGWFYTLLAVAVVLGYGTPFKNVICLGHVNDKFGKKMSKSKGNIVNPWEMAEKYGIDAVRWYFYTVTPPGEPKNFDETELGKTLRKLFFTVYNSFVFYETVPGPKRDSSPPASKNHVLDKWILARLNETVKETTEKLDDYNIGGAGRAIELFVDDLSRWYIRRSRKRPEMKKTLGIVLLQLSKLLAPFTPFFAEALYQSVSAKGGSASGGKNKNLSVHLEDWPRSKAPNRKLLSLMDEVRRLASAGLAKRAEAGKKVRQPLASMRVPDTKSGLRRNEALLMILAEEVNVKKIIFEPPLIDGVDLDLQITPELRGEGIVREFTRLIQDLRQDAGLNPKDRIHLMIEVPRELGVILAKNLKILGSAVGAEQIDFKKSAKFDAEISTKVDSASVWIGIRKLS